MSPEQLPDNQEAHNHPIDQEQVYGPVTLQGHLEQLDDQFNELLPYKPNGDGSRLKGDKEAWKEIGAAVTDIIQTAGEHPQDLKSKLTDPDQIRNYNIARHYLEFARLHLEYGNDETAKALKDAADDLGLNPQEDLLKRDYAKSDWLDKEDKKDTVSGLLGTLEAGYEEGREQAVQNYHTRKQLEVGQNRMKLFADEIKQEAEEHADNLFGKREVVQEEEESPKHEATILDVSSLKEESDARKQRAIQERQKTSDALLAFQRGFAATRKGKDEDAKSGDAGDKSKGEKSSEQAAVDGEGDSEKSLDPQEIMEKYGIDKEDGSIRLYDKDGQIKETGIIIDAGKTKDGEEFTIFFVTDEKVDGYPDVLSGEQLLEKTEMSDRYLAALKRTERGLPGDDGEYQMDEAAEQEFRGAEKRIKLREELAKKRRGQDNDRDGGAAAGEDEDEVLAGEVVSDDESGDKNEEEDGRSKGLKKRARALRDRILDKWDDLRLMGAGKVMADALRGGNERRSKKRTAAIIALLGVAAVATFLGSKEVSNLITSPAPKTQQLPPGSTNGERNNSGTTESDRGAAEGEDSSGRGSDADADQSGREGSSGGQGSGSGSGEEGRGNPGEGAGEEEGSAEGEGQDPEAVEFSSFDPQPGEGFTYIIARQPEAEGKNLTKEELYDIYEKMRARGGISQENTYTLPNGDLGILSADQPVGMDRQMLKELIMQKAGR